MGIVMWRSGVPVGCVVLVTLSCVAHGTVVSPVVAEPRQIAHCSDGGEARFVVLHDQTIDDAALLAWQMPDAKLESDDEVLLGESSAAWREVAHEGGSERVRIAALDVLGFYIERSTIPLTVRWDDAGAHRSMIQRVLRYGPGPIAAPCIESIARLCDDPSVRVRERAVMWLGLLGPVAAREYPRVVAMQNDPDPGVRCRVAWAAYSTKRDAVAAMQVCLEILDNAEASVMESCLGTIEKIGMEASVAMARVLKLKEHPDAGVREAAARAWARLHGREAGSW